MSASLSGLMPGFLGIGAMRAGTSWLAHHLARHPAIWLKRKEIHFFDRKIGRFTLPPLSWETTSKLRYGLRFLPGRLTGRVAGEFTPAYAVLKRDRIEQIHRWMPRAKILFMMRDPVDRAWSQANHDLSHRLGIDLETASRQKLTSFFDSPSVRRRGDYVTCLENWLNYFDRDQMKVSFLEDVVVDPVGVLRDVFSFLGVDPDAVMSSDAAEPVHAIEGPPLPDWAREYLTARVCGQDGRLEEIVGRPLPWRARPELGDSGVTSAPGEQSIPPSDRRP